MKSNLWKTNCLVFQEVFTRMTQIGPPREPDFALLNLLFQRMSQFRPNITVRSMRRIPNQAMTTYRISWVVVMQKTMSRDMGDAYTNSKTYFGICRRER